MKIAIAGYGQEGKASYNYWNQDGNVLTICDEREHVDDLPAGAKTVLGDDAFIHLDDYDMVIRSAGVAPRKLKSAKKIWSATNEFFEKCPAEIIGVTGTKGKGTTSSLITSILRAGGKTVHLVGNIGVPALEELPKINADDIVVFELSSFQLWDAMKSPHVAVVLGIEPDHLDIHADFEEYIAAKANIVRSQTNNDILVFNRNNQVATDIAALSAAGTKIEYPYNLGELVTSLVIPGAHNVENAAAAMAACRGYVSDERAMRRGLSQFTGLPHRIKFVREVEGVKFYDDSYSSAPSAAVAAIRSFSEPEVLLLGGRSKGGSFKELANEIVRSINVKKVVVYGETRHEIAKALYQANVETERYWISEETDFSSIVTQAYRYAENEGVVILSPACASFDMFDNFTDRGEKFIAIVESFA